jgi:hypothetical protein
MSSTTSPVLHSDLQLGARKADDLADDGDIDRPALTFAPDCQADLRVDGAADLGESRELDQG